VWVGGDASGVISVKNLYQALIKPLDFHCEKAWILKLWKWPIQLKIKLFLWLAAFDKILTWDVLQSKGWVGPGCASSATTTLKMSIIF
jgi:hypothetical protein